KSGLAQSRRGRGTGGDFGDRAADAGQILPRAGETDGFEANGWVGVIEQFGKSRSAFCRGRLRTAGSNRLRDGGEGAGRRRVVEAFVQDLPVKAVRLFTGPGAGDEIDPRPGTIGRKRFVAEKLAEDFAGARRFNGAKGELELLLATLRFPGARLDRFQPGW